MTGGLRGMILSREGQDASKSLAGGSVLVRIWAECSGLGFPSEHMNQGELTIKKEKSHDSNKLTTYKLT